MNDLSDIIIEHIKNYPHDDNIKKKYLLDSIISSIEKLEWEKYFFKTTDDIVKERVEIFTKLRDYDDILFE